MGGRRGPRTMTGVATAPTARAAAVLALAAILAVVVAAVLAPPGRSPAAAAGFACDKAVHADEVAVCETPGLSNLDVQMVTLYDVVLKLVGMGVRADLQDQQRAFLQARATCGADAACIAELYGQRIASLQKVIDDIAARGPY